MIAIGSKREPGGKLFIPILAQERIGFGDRLQQ
jgi:hypothetical protein